MLEEGSVLGREAWGLPKTVLLFCSSAPSHVPPLWKTSVVDLFACTMHTPSRYEAPTQLLTSHS